MCSGNGLVYRSKLKLTKFWSTCGKEKMKHTRQNQWVFNSFCVQSSSCCRTFVFALAISMRNTFLIIRSNGLQIGVQEEICYWVWYIHFHLSQSIDVKCMINFSWDCFSSKNCGIPVLQVQILLCASQGVVDVQNSQALVFFFLCKCSIFLIECKELDLH